MTDDERERDGPAEIGMVAVMMLLPLVKLWIEVCAGGAEEYA